MAIIQVQGAADALRDCITDKSLLPPRIQNVAFRLPGQKTGNRDFATHWLHRYPAKMFHRIPRIILQEFSTRGPLTVLDPFCGSGTVLLEAIILGHTAIGIDVNPLARLISRVKTRPISREHLRSHLRSIRMRAEKFESQPAKDKTLDFWFKLGVRKKLHALSKSVECIQHDSCREFFALCVSACVRQCSWADPTIAPPVRLRRNRITIAGDRYREHFLRAHKLRAADVMAEFERVVEDNLFRMNSLFELKNLGNAEVLGEGCHASTTKLDDASVDLVLTSPPYCGAQKYVRSLRLEMLILGMSAETIAEADRNTLGTERVKSNNRGCWDFTPDQNIADLISRVNDKNPTRGFMLAEYLRYLNDFARELFRILKPGGDAFLTFGPDRVCGIEVDSAKLFAQMAQRYSLQHLATFIDTIPSRGMITIRHLSASVIADEHVVWLRRI